MRGGSYYVGGARSNCRVSTASPKPPHPNPKFLSGPDDPTQFVQFASGALAPGGHYTIEHRRRVHL